MSSASGIGIITSNDQLTSRPAGYNLNMSGNALGTNNANVIAWHSD